MGGVLVVPRGPGVARRLAKHDRDGPGGQRRRLDLALGLVGDPELLAGVRVLALQGLARTVVGLAKFVHLRLSGSQSGPGLGQFPATLPSCQ